jgi:PAS domain S-box-containing protein
MTSPGGSNQFRGQAATALTTPDARAPRLSAFPTAGMLLAIVGLLVLIALVTTDWVTAAAGEASTLAELAAAALAGAALAAGGFLVNRADPAAAAERLSLARLIHALDALPDGIAIWDADDRLVLWNRAYAELLGDRREELLRPGISFESLIRGIAEAGLALDARRDPEGWIVRRMEQHRAASGPSERRMLDGRWRRVFERRLPQGGMLTALTDVSELKSRERALQESRERHTLALHGANECLWEWNLATGQLYLSSRMTSLLDIEFPEVTPANWLARIHPEDRDGYVRTFRAHLRGESEVFQCEYRMSDDKGRWRWVFDRALALRDSTGRAYRMAGSLGEITERKRVEAELRLAKEEAELASRSKSEFLANVSHELRTPLNAIIGFSDIMRQEMFGGLGSPEYKSYAEDIHVSGQHLLALINDILDVSKAEAGKLELREETIDVKACIEASLRLVHERAEQGRIELIDASPAKLPALTADERKFKQALLNLLSNAVKFTPEGGSVTVEAEIAGEGDLLLRVVDTGIGMTGEQMRRAMRPFEQIDSAFNRKYEGTGLGLPIIDALMRLHGGAIEIESEPGRGTRATLRFPKSRVEAG